MPLSQIKDKNGEKASHLQQMFGGRGRAAQGTGLAAPGDAAEGWDQLGLVLLRTGHPQPAGAKPRASGCPARLGCTAWRGLSHLFLSGFFILSNI